MFDKIDLDEKEVPFNPLLNETVVEFLSRQAVKGERDPDILYECRRCADCCRWNYYKLDTPQSLIDQLYMIGPKYPHGYWTLIEDTLHLYMPTWTPKEGEAKLFHFDGKIPQKHVEFCWRSGRTHGYWVLNDEQKIVVYCPVTCQNLTENNMCSIYRERPQVCRDYLCGRYPVEEKKDG